MNAASKYSREIRRNAPIEYNGLTFYPLTVSEYEIFLSAKPTFELMQGSLPPALARMGWLECLWALDRQCLESTGNGAGFTRAFVQILAETLKLEPRKNTNGRYEYPLRPALDNTGNITGIIVFKDNAPVLITRQQAGEIRQIIAAQNGYQLPNENWNAQLLREAKIGKKGISNLKTDLEDLVSSVAVCSGLDPDTIWDWPIRKFELAQRAVDRKLGYEIFTSAEMSGMVKFERGNPYPTWKYDRASDMPDGFKTLDELEASTKGFFGDQGAFKPVKTK